jgi:hypothetical protein
MKVAVAKLDTVANPVAILDENLPSAPTELLVFDEPKSVIINGFHRTSDSLAPVLIAFRGFVGEPGSTYGQGFYLGRDFNIHLKRSTYGRYVVHSLVDMSNVLILDRNLAIEIFGKPLSIMQQLELYKIRTGMRRTKTLLEGESATLQRSWHEEETSVLDNSKKGALVKKRRLSTSSMVAGHIYNVIKQLGLSGIAYTGREDGPCLVIYKTEQVVPLRWGKLNSEISNIDDVKWTELKGREIRRIRNGLAPLTQRWFNKWAELPVDECVAKCIRFSQLCSTQQFFFLLHDMHNLTEHDGSEVVIRIHTEFQQQIQYETLRRHILSALKEPLGWLMNKPNGIVSCDAEYSASVSESSQLGDDDDFDDEEEANGIAIDIPMWRTLIHKNLYGFTILRRRIIQLVQEIIREKFNERFEFMLANWVNQATPENLEPFIEAIKPYDDLFTMMRELSGLTRYDWWSNIHTGSQIEFLSKTIKGEKKLVAMELDRTIAPYKTWLWQLSRDPLVVNRVEINILVGEIIGKTFSDAGIMRKMVSNLPIYGGKLPDVDNKPKKRKIGKARIKQAWVNSDDIDDVDDDDVVVDEYDDDNNNIDAVNAKAKAAPFDDD